MGIERIRWWMWMIVGCLIGWLASMIYLADKVPDLQTTSAAVVDQSRFETFLMATEGATPKFTDIVVHPYTLKENGQSKPALIVTGVYHRNATDVPQPMHFLAAGPYKPVFSLTYLGRPSGDAMAKRFSALSQPTIQDYLNLLGEARGFAVPYAWWEEPGRITAIGVAGGFVLVGLLWPALINLLTYHRLIRPKEARGVSLIGVAGSSPAPKAAPALEGAIDNLTADLESRLAERQADRPLPQTAAASTTPRPLDSTPLSAAQIPHGPEIEFGAKPDDFYPTERHTSGEKH